jgi:hypothetical protein
MIVDLGTILHLFSVALGVGALILAYQARSQLERVLAFLRQLF